MLMQIIFGSNLFKLFGAYFKKEIKALGDEALKQEQAVLEKL